MPDARRAFNVMNYRVRLWLVVGSPLSVAVASCADQVSCPGDLVARGEGCVCEDDAKLRSEPLRSDSGEPSYCVETSPPERQDGGAEPDRDGSRERPISDAGSGVRATALADASADGVDAYVPPKSPPVDTLPPPDPAAIPVPQQPQPVTVVGDPRDGKPCTPAIWYRDCDADTFAATRGGSITSCTPPAPALNCLAWTAVEPVADKIDCNDNSAAYAPGAGYGVALDGNGDRNCDGVLESYLRRDYAPRNVDAAPPEEATFCRYGAKPMSQCNCFLWESSATTEPPPCARYPGETFLATYQVPWPPDPSGAAICDAAATSATDTVDFYHLLHTCR